MTTTIEDLAARVVALEAEQARHCSPGKWCPSCSKSRAMNAQAEMFNRIMIEGQRREQMIRDEAIAKAKATPRVKVSSAGAFVLQIADTHTHGKSLFVALDRSAKQGSKWITPTVAAWQRAMVELPDLARAVAIGELTVESCSLQESLAARPHDPVDQWAAL